MPFQVLSFLHPHILATIKKYLLANHFSKALKVWSGFTNYPSFMSQNPHIHSIDSRLTEVSIRDSRSQDCIASSFFLWCSWKFSRTERVLAVHAFSTMAKGHPQRAQSCFQNPRARKRVMKTHWNKYPKEVPPWSCQMVSMSGYYHLSIFCSYSWELPTKRKYMILNPLRALSYKKHSSMQVGHPQLYL